MALVNDFGESKVTIKKDELLTAIKANLEQHKKDYDEALIGFRAAAIEAMQKNLERAQSGGEVKLGIALTIPVEHTKDYDRVIRILTMSTANEIMISESQFTQYVMDDWNWKAAFVGSTAAYNNKR
jgi:hypothetical protein